MNAFLSEAERTALITAELHAEAALRKVSIAQVVKDRAHRTMDESGKVAGRVWREMDRSTRLLLVLTATELKPEAADTPWYRIGGDDRLAIGALARQLSRDLRGAEWLRG